MARLFWQVMLGQSLFLCLCGIVFIISIVIVGGSFAVENTKGVLNQLKKDRME